jgi:hypothetical protein
MPSAHERAHRRNVLRKGRGDAGQPAQGAVVTREPPWRRRWGGGTLATPVAAQQAYTDEDVPFNIVALGPDSLRSRLTWATSRCTST